MLTAGVGVGVHAHNGANHLVWVFLLGWAGLGVAERADSLCGCGGVWGVGVCDEANARETKNITHLVHYLVHHPTAPAEP